MSEETDVKTGLVIVENEQMNEKRGRQEKSSPIENFSTVIMSG